ncbi:MAG: UDP-N-acetylmuramate--L-alanine ligase [Clostridia bacterium]|nr:UDP-N-acetylmuramate--L-alanine ligase [Clostridia bacterium]
MDFDLKDYSRAGRRVHFIGIGGVSMNALAQALHARGCSVTGNDRTDSPVTERLRAAGIPVSVGHAAEYVRGADAVVRNAAIHDDSPDVAEARRLGLPVYERPQVLGALMREHEKCICVAGTHGKSTGSSMLSAITLAAGLDPTIFIGANYAPIGGTYRLGNSPVLVAEACEYCDSFLSFFPETAVILNIEEDHLDYFSGIEQIRDSFRRFALRTPETGCVICNADDENCRKALADLPRRVITFGERGDVRAERVEFVRGHGEFDLTNHGETLCRIRLGVPGDFNIKNALAASAAALNYGLAPEVIAAALADFHGAGRRMELRGEFRGIPFYDDYAHHPSELAVALRTAKTMTEGRVVCVFQPHTYTRTRTLMPDFVRSLKLADEVILPPIYAAREADDGVTSSVKLAAQIPGAHAVQSLDEAAALLGEIAKPGDIILAVGAGDIVGLYDLL